MATLKMPMIETNIDRIKGMDEDEMAEFITHLYGVAYMEHYPAPEVEEVKEWLSKPKGVQ
jgi:hypothetical protein